MFPDRLAFGSGDPRVGCADGAGGLCSPSLCRKAVRGWCLQGYVPDLARSPERHASARFHSGPQCAALAGQLASCGPRAVITSVAAARNGWGTDVLLAAVTIHPSIHQPEPREKFRSFRLSNHPPQCPPPSARLGQGRRPSIV